MSFRRFFGTGPDAPPLADRARVDSLYRRNRALVLAAITLGYGFSYTCRLGLSVVKKPLIDSGLLTADQLGTIGAALLYTYGLGKLTNGFLADHANVRTFFAAGLLASACLNLLLGGVAGALLWVWVALWALNGWFQGFGAPASAVALSHWFANRERGRYYGIWNASHAIGEGLTFLVTAAIVGAFGWRFGFYSAGTLCVLVAVALFFWLRDRPQTLGLPPVADWKADHAVAKAKAEPGHPLRASQLFVLRSPAIWVMGLSNALMYVSRYAINSWGILYLQEGRGYSLSMASLFMTVNTVAAVAGTVAFGFVSDKLFAARRPPANLLFGAAEVVALALIFWTPPGHPWLLGFAFGLFGFSLSGILASLGGLFAIDVAPKRAAGAAMGFIGVFGYLGAALQDQVSGHLIREGTTVVNGLRQYDFSAAIAVWIGASALSLVLAATLWRVRVAE